MVPPFNFFSALCDFFFEIFLMSQRVPPLSFLLFCYRMRVYKSKRVPLLHFSALCDIFRKKNFFSKISSFFQKKVLRFMSLRYNADLRRSRLVRLPVAMHDAIMFVDDNNVLIYLQKQSRIKDLCFMPCYFHDA